ncbi:aminoglycoside phosphotransferase family protein [Aquibacillus koreensis]|uniref:Aminoglycoside phosphotransferase family protein n=1 Tax=Aquibacillus koreensis TaxID=279446 RepID=A0A9X3WIC6_9BACI|nr:aminoglycoside phosphotransferase family protein [Aquibacillus koreensis]MCT2537976.1 aminoglycoside phosphotransferase family protein [Aquibacillus koreensis]MDC3419133.1 aminoglycoside phosphotransferase family protein [Aquibacillus koreensis]
MNSNKFRDDSILNRLASFLYHEGGLIVTQVKQIKDRVFKVWTNEGESLILKGKPSLTGLVQQWDFFQEIESAFICKFTPFPNGKRMLHGLGFYWVITPFIEGEQMCFDKPEDRHDVLEVLKLFHKDAEGIELPNPILRQPLYARWNGRIEKLEKMRPLMQQLGYHAFYKDLLYMTHHKLNRFKAIDWHLFEADAVEKLKWIHGDVASHNFIRGINGKVYMIDFDLLSLSPPIYEYIQLGQRFLPSLTWDVSSLMSYCIWEDEQMIQTWLLGITVPSDLIRDLWYFINGNRNVKEIDSYLDRLTNSWYHRLEFVEHVEEMLR